jgi:maltose O-acetyltransferase
MPGPYGMFCRHIIYAILLKKKGKLVLIREGVKFFYPERISIGDYSGVHEECKLDGSGKINIGKYVRLAPRVEIMTSNHIFKDISIPIKLQGLEFKRVVIEDDVWIGIGVLIVPGVRIGKGSVVAGHSVVTKDVPQYSVVAGVPAKVISSRSGENSLNNY